MCGQALSICQANEEGLSSLLCQLDDKHENSDADLQSLKGQYMPASSVPQPEMKNNKVKSPKLIQILGKYVNEDFSPLSIMFSHQHRKEPNFIRLLLQVDGLKPIDYAIDGVGVKNSFKRGYESSDFNGVSCTLFRTYRKKSG